MNANDTLGHFTGTEDYHKYLFGFLLTDGAKELATKFSCFWFLDIVASYKFDKRLLGHGFQVWKLTKDKKSGAKVTCEDGNYNVLLSQRIESTDFEADEATVWVEGNVILLPSEH